MLGCRPGRDENMSSGHLTRAAVGDAPHASATISVTVEASADVLWLMEFAAICAGMPRPLIGNLHVPDLGGGISGIGVPVKASLDPAVIRRSTHLTSVCT